MPRKFASVPKLHKELILFLTEALHRPGLTDLTRPL